MTTVRPALVLWLIPFVYFVFVAAEIGALTHLMLTATEGGYSATAVGAVATAMWAGILAASWRAHALVARHGHARVFAAGTLLAMLALVSLALHASLAGWIAGVVVLGIGGGLVWVAGEAWLAETAPPDRRGFFVGLFETAVGLGFMAGPMIVPLTRALALPTLVVTACVMVAALCAAGWLLTAQRLARGAGRAPDGATRPAAWRALALPLIAIAVVSGVMESGISALLPTIAMRLDFSFNAAAWLGAVIGAGSALLQAPIGVVADRWGVRPTTLVAWAIVIATNALLLVVAADPGRWLWAIGFALGGVGGAVYTLVIVEMGHRLSGDGLVRAVALLVIAYSIGTAAGPALGGALFDFTGLAGLAAFMVVLSVLGLAVTAAGLRSVRQDRGGQR